MTFSLLFFVFECDVESLRYYIENGVRLIEAKKYKNLNKKIIKKIENYKIVFNLTILYLYL